MQELDAQWQRQRRVAGHRSLSQRRLAVQPRDPRCRECADYVCRRCSTDELLPLRGRGYNGDIMVAARYSARNLGRHPLAGWPRTAVTIRRLSRCIRMLALESAPSRAERLSYDTKQDKPRGGDASSHSRRSWCNDGADERDPRMRSKGTTIVPA